MKLIEILSLYLPYKLYLYDGVRKKPVVMNLGDGTSTNWAGIKSVCRYQEKGNYVYKPILYPLSMLTQEIEHQGERFVPTMRLKQHLMSGEGIGLFGLDEKEVDTLISMLLHVWTNPNRAPQYVFNWLLKHHFDVFNFIPAGKAIDKSNL